MMKKQTYKFTAFLDHTQQSLKELLSWYLVIKDQKLSDREKEIAKNAYLSGSRDAMRLIKLHGGFKFGQ